MRIIRSRIALLAAAALVLAGAGAVVALSQRGGEQAIGGAFDLIDSAGAPVSDKDFEGRYRIMYFGYTFCPDVCPTALSRLAAALDELSPEQQSKLSAMFISVDPERDHGEILDDYAQAFHPLIHGYTGTPEKLGEAAERYRVSYAFEENASDDTYYVDHSSIIYVFGPDGRYITHFTHRSSVEKITLGLQSAIPG